MIGSGPDDVAITLDGSASCSQIVADAPLVYQLLPATAAGYFLVSIAFVETVNVLFNRWD